MELYILGYRIRIEIKKRYIPTIEEIRLYPGYENSYYDKNGKLIKE